MKKRNKIKITTLMIVVLFILTAFLTTVQAVELNTEIKLYGESRRLCFFGCY